MRSGHRPDLPPFPVFLAGQVLVHQGIRTILMPCATSTRKSHPVRSTYPAPVPAGSPAVRVSDRRPRRRPTTGASCDQRPCRRRGPSPVGFRLELNILGNPGHRATVLVVQMLGRHPDPGADQRMTPRCRVAAVHRFHAVGDPTRTPHVRAFDPRRGHPCFCCPDSSSAPTTGSQARCSITKPRTTACA